MFAQSSLNGFSLKAYKGSQMTMLAMNLADKPDKGSFAGFTIFYTSPKGIKNPIQNLLNFQGSDQITGSDISPIQLFKWVHFPGSYQQTGSLTGKYIYEATPRYFDLNKKLLPLDPAKSVRVPIEVDDFHDGNLSIGFTRGFIKSQAFSNRYGAKQKLVPSGDWLFDTTKIAGTNAKYGDFSYEDMYMWLGFNARKIIIDLLEEALIKGDEVEMFAYDFNDSVIASKCLELAKKGKIRIILDDAALHSGMGKNGKLAEEDEFEFRFNKVKKPVAEVFRFNFARYSHCKEIILKSNGIPYKVLTGSTNFSSTGLYVNANHVLVFDNQELAKYYSDVFNICWKIKSAGEFRKSIFANRTEKFTVSGIPTSEINVSPHNETYATALIDSITSHIKDSGTKSVLFSVMDLAKSSTGSLIHTLREIHKDDSIFTYGVTDNGSGEISLYKPGKKTGLLIDAKKANRELPPPFKKEYELGLSHAIHHKFIVTNFNMESARVYCGSSNLALGGEKANGDNLLCIKDIDVATVFAIEALRLTDHYNFRSVKDKEKKPGVIAQPVKLDNTGEWINKFYDPDDIRFVERGILA